MNHKVKEKRSIHKKVEKDDKLWNDRNKEKGSRGGGGGGRGGRINRDRLSILSANYKTIQSSVSERSELSQYLSALIKEQFNEKSTCQETWKNLFTTDWYEKVWSFGRTSKLGSGAHGAVYKVFLRHVPNLPLAIKSTDDMELGEARRDILLSSLVEAKVNPHFIITYAHLHCEKLQSKSLKQTLQKKLVPWNEGMNKIIQLQERILEIKNTLETHPSHFKEMQQLESTVKLISDNLYVDDETLNYYRNLAKSKKEQLNAIYESANSIEEENVTNFDIYLMQELEKIIKSMQKIRQKHHRPFELILMEMADGSFDNWIDKSPNVKNVLSAIFQICCAFLSMLSFFQLIQNDLLLKNIMFNNVDNKTTYIYKIKNTYFRVPLGGKLFKVIDFGLSANIKEFNGPNAGNLHWCVGGREPDVERDEFGENYMMGFKFSTSEPENLQCAAYMRDILELFYRLQFVYYGDAQLMKWIKMGYEKAKGTKKDNIESAVQFVLYMFQPTTLEAYQLPTFQTFTDLPINNNQGTVVVFDILNKKRYNSTIKDIIKSKVTYD